MTKETELKAEMVEDEKVLAYWVEQATSQKKRAEDAERRLAEVEERAREDERDRLYELARRRSGITVHPTTQLLDEALADYLKTHDAMYPSERRKLRDDAIVNSILAMSDADILASAEPGEEQRVQDAFDRAKAALGKSK